MNQKAGRNGNDFLISQEGSAEHGLDVENTLWANCVVASGSALGLVVYTGAETRSVMNNSQPRSKVGLLDIEINQLTKVRNDTSNRIEIFQGKNWNMMILHFRFYSLP